MCIADDGRRHAKTPRQNAPSSLLNVKLTVTHCQGMNSALKQEIGYELKGKV